MPGPRKLRKLIDLILSDQDRGKMMDVQFLIANPIIDLEDISGNPSLSWSWSDIAARSDLTLSFIKRHRKELEPFSALLRAKNPWVERTGLFPAPATRTEYPPLPTFHDAVINERKVGEPLPEHREDGVRLSTAEIGWYARNSCCATVEELCHEGRVSLRDFMRMYPYIQEGFELPHISRKLLVGFGDEWWKLIHPDPGCFTILFSLIERNLDELMGEKMGRVLRILLQACRDIPKSFLTKHLEMFDDVDVAFMEWEAVCPEDGLELGMPIAAFASSPNLLLEQIDDTVPRTYLDSNPLTRHRKRVSAVEKIERWWLRVGIYDTSFPAAMRHAEKKFMEVLGC